MTAFDLAITNARVHLMDDAFTVIERGTIGVRGDRLAYVGTDAISARRVIDARGRAAMPGLVDCHTHLVFAGDRADEFARKMRGETYAQIAASGGGIMSTVRATRAATDDQLVTLVERRLAAMLAHGVTTIEIKTGYGLSVEEETRHVGVIERVKRKSPQRISTTLLGAHVVPEERKTDRAGYVADVASKMIPTLAKRVDSCDVYLEAGAFDRSESETILRAAKSHGLHVRAHVGQLADLDGATLVAALRGRSCDHVEHVSDAGLSAMAGAGVRAVLLPGAWRTLRQTPPDARRIKAAGVAVAIATDCNPGTSFTTDLPLAAALAVRDAGVVPEDALAGITREAAYVLGLETECGRIAVGLAADVALFPFPDAREITYAMGDVFADVVVAGGRVVREP